MKKVIYVLILLLVAVSGLVFANREFKPETAEKPAPKPLSAADRKNELKIWEASPDGIQFKMWETSPAGKKVYAGVAKIRKHINSFTDMKAVITSLTLPPGSRLGFGRMARIDGVDYIITFDPQKSQLEQLRNLKVNDKIIIRSRNVSFAPKYAYPIVTVEYAEWEHKAIFKRVLRKGGC